MNIIGKLTKSDQHTFEYHGIIKIDGKEHHLILFPTTYRDKKTPKIQTVYCMDEDEYRKKIT